MNSIPFMMVQIDKKNGKVQVSRILGCGGEKHDYIYRPTAPFSETTLEIYQQFFEKSINEFVNFLKSPEVNSFGNPDKNTWVGNYDTVNWYFS